MCDIHTNGNVFLAFIVCDVHTNRNDWVSMPRPIAHELILPHTVCQEGLSSTVSGSCGKDPPIAHTHLAMVPNVVAERGLKRLYSTDAYQCHVMIGLGLVNLDHVTLG